MPAKKKKNTTAKKKKSKRTTTTTTTTVTTNAPRGRRVVQHRNHSDSMDKTLDYAVKGAITVGILGATMGMLRPR